MEYIKRLPQLQMMMVTSLSGSHIGTKLTKAHLLCGRRCSSLHSVVPPFTTTQQQPPTIADHNQQSYIRPYTRHRHHLNDHRQSTLFHHRHDVSPSRKFDRFYSTRVVDPTRKIVSIHVENTDRYRYRSIPNPLRINNYFNRRNISRTTSKDISTLEKMIMNYVGRDPSSSLSTSTTSPETATTTTTTTTTHNGMTQQPPVDESFQIIRIDVNTGDVETLSYTPSDILAQTCLLPRDLVSLNISSNRRQQQQGRGKRFRTGSSSGKTLMATMRDPPAILSRRDCILLSFGPIRAVAELDCVYIFDVHKEVARSFAVEVSQVYRFRAAMLAQDQHHLQQEEEKKLHQGHDIGDISQTGKTIRIATSGTTSSLGYRTTVPPHVHEDPPELVFLETVLDDVVDSFARRVQIFKPIVDDLLLRVSTDEEFSGSGIHQLAPLKEQLQSFEVFVNQAYNCLKHLLNDDGEMLNLLITEQAEARRTNVPVDFERHQQVEVLLGVYSRQISSIIQEVNHLLSRIESKQQFLDLELALYRNRLIRMNIDLGILAVATGITTAVTGTFGMNLISGLEQSSTAFMAVSAGSALSALLVANFFWSRVSGKVIQRRAKRRIDEIKTLSSALSDMSAVDYTVKKMMKGHRMDREEFKKQLNMARYDQTYSDKEIDLLFQILNTHKDDFLDYWDFSSDDEDDSEPRLDDSEYQQKTHEAGTTKQP